MALSMPIPPWLATRPAEHAQASESGLSAGLQAAHIWAQAAAEKARLEETARQRDREAAMEAERLQQKSVYDAQKLAADVAYNKAALSQAQAKITQTQANAARMARQWEGQMQLAREKAQAAAQARTEQLELGQTRAAETARHNLAMETRAKGVPEDAMLAAYAKQSREGSSGPGIIDRIKNLFSGGTAPAKVGASPYQEGTYITNKKDGKTYIVKNGLPVLVDSEEPKEEPAPDETE